ncbi:calmodulin-like protein 4 [Diadema antillarum]|uniref:calmodulin-like protein 4 n=1 Tax=Diadema antillarum TaxID=105358 RepID=UPI003A889F81
MAQLFTQKQIDEYKECFALYDKSRKGVVFADELTKIMRSLGSNPTVEEIKDYRKKYEKDNRITFSDFLEIMYEQQKVENPFKEIMDAFRLTDTQNRGFIMASEFRNIMTKFGEKISDREVDDIMRELGIQKNGFVKYYEIVPRLLEPIPDHFK